MLVARVAYPLCKRHPHDRSLLTLLELLGDVRVYTLVTLAPRTGLVAVVVLNLFALAYSSRLARSLALSLSTRLSVTLAHVRTFSLVRSLSIIHSFIAVLLSVVRSSDKPLVFL